MGTARSASRPDASPGERQGSILRSRSQRSAPFRWAARSRIRCDGCAEPVAATVSYVSTQPEFTPPIIYSNENRAKLVFMIEARPTAEGARALRPGQPVEVRTPMTPEAPPRIFD